MNKTTVLIAEDEAIVAADLASKLGQLGYEVVGSPAAGEEAVELACRLMPQVVLMDIWLKGSMDGIEAAEAIRRRIDVPVIYLTAHSDSATLTRAKLSEPFGYIIKPFEERELATTIEMALYKHQSDRQQREQREWLRVTLTSIGDAVISCDTDGLVTFLNPVAETLTGWSNEEARKEPIQEVFRLINEQTCQPPEDPVALVLREGRPKALANHTALVTRDGREIPIEDCAAPILAADGRVIGAVLVFHEVTEKRRAQRAMRKSHDELAQRTAELQTANETLRASRLAALNLMEDAVVARKQAEETSVELRHEIAERKRAEARLLQLNRALTARNNSSHALRDALHETAYLEQLCRIIVDDCGHAMVWVGYAEQDETKSVRPVASAGFDEGYLETLGITWADTERGRGPTGTAIRTGRPATCDNMLTDPNLAPWRSEALKRGYASSLVLPLLAEGKAFGAITIYSKEPAAFSEEEIALLYKLAGDTADGILTIRLRQAHQDAEEALQKAHDELETKVEERTAELREKDQILLQQSRQAAMGEMIGNIAHQWRQPLNTLGLLIGMLPMMQEAGELTTKQLESMEEKAMGIIQHMSQTINDFSDYFKPDKERAMFRAGDAVTKTLILIEDSFRSREIAIEVQAADDPIIDGYPNEFSQVLLNILLNARDAFTERCVREPKVVINMATENGRAVVTVSDNAGGISEDIIDKIFDPYFTTKGPENGTGVGLFMSKGIIEKNMGGLLSARNTFNGAEFRIEV
jgi:PAS domain S-box-containing protein